MVLFFLDRSALGSRAEPFNSFRQSRQYVIGSEFHHTMKSDGKIRLTLNYITESSMFRKQTRHLMIKIPLAILPNILIIQRVHNQITYYFKRFPWDQLLKPNCRVRDAM
jgi:hypothetical protein